MKNALIGLLVVIAASTAWALDGLNREERRKEAEFLRSQIASIDQYIPNPSPDQKAYVETEQKEIEKIADPMAKMKRQATLADTKESQLCRLKGLCRAGLDAMATVLKDDVAEEQELYGWMSFITLFMDGTALNEGVVVLNRTKVLSAADTMNMGLHESARGYGFPLSREAARIMERIVMPLYGRRLSQAAAVQGQQPPDQARPLARPKSLPRPKLTQVRPGSLQDQPRAVSNYGVVGVDAHFSEFGDYLQELIDIVQIQWDRVLAQNSTATKPSTHVMISFRINSKGEIAKILKTDGDAGEYATRAAVSAILERAPYRAWTKEMVAVLGDEQVINFTFYYW